MSLASPTAMKVTVFSAKPYDIASLSQANADQHELRFLDTHLTKNTAMLAEGAPAVCAFVNDDLSEPVLQKLAARNVKLIALRCAGFNNVDLTAVKELGLAVARVPAYSPHAVAEHATALLLALNRKIHRSYTRVREGNFSLNGLSGFDLRGRSVGIIGAGKIGSVFAKIMTGFDCEVFAHDKVANADCRRIGVQFIELEELLHRSDIVSLHCPLTPETHHIIDKKALQTMKSEAVLINTGRGGLVDAKALIDALKARKIGAVGLDVYEEEEELFFEDRSSAIIQDDTFARLLTFPNVIMTAHQGFFTQEAIQEIAKATIENLSCFEVGSPGVHLVGK